MIKFPALLLLLVLKLNLGATRAAGFWANENDDDKISPPTNAYHFKHSSIDTRFVPERTNDEENRISIDDMTCDFFTQPLNHFVPRGNSPKYRQRYCVYSDFATNNTTSPILFYTGNESPLEQYINHTGLMWELAPILKARVVFVEHRYEGKSLPDVSSQCLSYASTIQALADFARIIETHINPQNTAPLFAFGGSYGGMLSAWIRMKYPHLVHGAIAASAPIGAFPHSAMTKIDWSARVLAAALSRPYPPNNDVVSNKESEPNHCPNNLMVAMPLITWIAEQDGSAEFLQQVFRLCEPLTGDKSTALLAWIKSIWFDLAEGSFPYPSNYIPFSLIHTKMKLPAWPMQYACWKSSSLHKDWNVTVSGNLTDVRYKVAYGDSGLSLGIDWETVYAKPTFSLDQIKHSSDVLGLLNSVRDAVSVWYNITKDMKCYDIANAAPNMNAFHRDIAEERQLSERKNDPAKICQDAMKEMGSWPPLCCNDEMNLVITEAHGMGNDFFWPPSHPRGTKTYADIVQNRKSAPCSDPEGIFGFSKEPYDPWSTWLETYYGEGSNMEGHSNIIFSNGLLDPWSAGGVYAESPWGSNSPYNGPSVQNITENDIIALIIEYGGHHTDLMYSSKSDPNCVTRARQVIKDYLIKWIENFKK